MVNQIKKLSRIKEKRNSISYMECAIKFNIVSSTITVLLVKKKYLLKLEKPHYLMNYDFDKKYE